MGFTKRLLVRVVDPIGNVRSRAAGRSGRAQRGATGQKEWADVRELEQAGEAKVGAGELPDSFHKMPRPKDPGDSVRRALSEEREKGY